MSADSGNGGPAPTASMRGIKVLDFSMGVAGPHAGALCALHGAEVVKIESREGDWSRVLGEQHGDFSAFSVVYNRGKRSLSIDLKNEQAQAAVRRMAQEADVVIEAFRPGVMRKFGLDYDSLREANPRLIYLSINGFGSAGSMVDEPAVDVVMQAFTGFMYANADDDGLPQRLDFVVIDAVTGLYGFQAISMALLERARFGGSGYRVECSLMSAAMALQAGKILESHVESGERAMYVPLGVFATADGFVSLSARRDDHFALLSRLLGRPDWVEGGRYARAADRVRLREEFVPQLEAELRKHGTDALCRLLTEAGILNSRVNTYAAAVRHDQVRANQAVAWQPHAGFDDPLPIAAVPGTQGLQDAAQAPRIGEHSLGVLRDWGVPDALVAQLLEEGAVSATPGRRPGAVPR